MAQLVTQVSRTGLIYYFRTFLTSFSFKVYQLYSIWLQKDHTLVESWSFCALSQGGKHRIHLKKLLPLGAFTSLCFLFLSFTIAYFSCLASCFLLLFFTIVMYFIILYLLSNQGPAPHFDFNLTPMKKYIRYLIKSTFPPTLRSPINIIPLFSLLTLIN